MSVNFPGNYARRSSLAGICTGMPSFGGVNPVRRANIPVQNITMNSVPEVAGDVYMPQAAQAAEGSVIGSTASSVGLMAPFFAAHTITHPKTSYEALKSAQEIYNKSKTGLFKNAKFKTLPIEQQANAFKTIYKYEKFGSKVANPILKDGLRDLMKDYKKALKSGDAVLAAQKGAEINTILSKGRNSFFGLRKAKGFFDIGKMAATASAEAGAKAKAGIEAAKIAKDNIAAVANGTKTAKAMAYGKNALAWTKSSLKVGGAGPMAVIEGVLEAPDVYKAFSDGGLGEGVKQTAKSSVKVAASVGGWCVGAKAGAAGGAALGTAICPGIGTAIGSVIGMLAGGIGGSLIAGKAAKAVTGPSYAEKKEAEQQQIATQVPPQYEYQPEFNPMVMPQYSSQNYPGFAPYNRPLYM